MITTLRRFAALAALAALPAAQAGDFVFASNFDGAWVSGYHVGYQRDLMPLSAIDFNAVTHLVVGRITPNTDGTLNTTFDIDPTNGPIFAQQASAAAHTGHSKALLMVGGAGEYGWSSAANAAHRATFVSNLISRMDAYGYDGLDLDWEPLENVDRPNFVALLQALRAARPHIILTFPVGWTNPNYMQPDPWYGTIAPLLDQINIMSYGMAYSWDGWKSWHSSAIYSPGGATPSSIETSVQYYLDSNVPPHKLGIGIGFYGTCWYGVTGVQQVGGTAGANDNDMSFHNIMQGYYTAGRYHYDGAAFAPYLSSATGFGPQNCNFVSYEDETSVFAKGTYVRNHALGGTIIWTLGQGYIPERTAGQRDTLLQAVKSGFRP